MESSLKFRNNSYQSNNSSSQISSKISNLISNVNTDPTITSNSSTTVVMEKDLNKNTSKDKSSGEFDNDITIKPRYLNFGDTIQHNPLLEVQKQREIDSDNDISPVFESPDTLKRNLLNHDSVPGYIGGNKNINSTKIYNDINASTKFKQKRSISELRKQLGTPVPLPYLNKDGSKAITKASNTILNTRPSVKYVAPIRKQAILSEKSHHGLDRKSSPKLLTLDRLEEKQHIVTNRWRDLLIRDKAKVEDRLKQLKLRERENINKNDSIQSPKKIQHSIFVNKDDMPSRLNEPSNDISTIETKVTREDQKDRHGEVGHLVNGSDINEISILKLQEEIQKNANKLDLIILMLKGYEEKDVTSMNQPLPKWNKFITFRFSKCNLLWTICIIILLLCQIYVLKYL